MTVVLKPEAEREAALDCIDSDLEELEEVLVQGRSPNFDFNEIEAIHKVLEKDIFELRAMYEEGFLIPEDFFSHEQKLENYLAELEDLEREWGKEIREYEFFEGPNVGCYSPERHVI